MIWDTVCVQLLMEGRGATVEAGLGGNSLLAGAVVGAAAERHSDHAAGEGHEDGMVVPVQLQAQHPPILATHVTPAERERGGKEGEGHAFFFSGVRGEVKGRRRSKRRSLRRRR